MVKLHVGSHDRVNQSIVIGSVLVRVFPVWTSSIQMVITLSEIGKPVNVAY